MGSEDAPVPPATEAPSPSDEEILEAEAAEPKLAPVEPPTEIYAARTEAPAADEPALEDEEDEEFWSDQRLSDELDQALEAPIEHEPVPPEPPAAAPAPPADEPDEDDFDDDKPRRGRRSPRPSRPTTTPTPVTRTCSRTPPSSSRTPRRTTSSGSSSVPRRTSTSTTS